MYRYFVEFLGLVFVVFYSATYIVILYFSREFFKTEEVGIGMLIVFILILHFP